MEPEHIIDEKATIQGADIEKVCNGCLWFFKKPWSPRTLSTHIIAKEKPTHCILKISQDIMKLWMQVDRIHFIFEINIHQSMNDIVINLKIRAESKNHPYAYAFKLTERLWKNLGIEVDDSFLKRLWSARAAVAALRLVVPEKARSIATFGW
jgi:hypothetical protein